MNWQVVFSSIAVICLIATACFYLKAADYQFDTLAERLPWLIPAVLLTFLLPFLFGLAAA